jgi:hypothetical protein
VAIRNVRESNLGWYKWGRFLCPGLNLLHGNDLDGSEGSCLAFLVAEGQTNRFRKGCVNRSLDRDEGWEGCAHRGFGQAQEIIFAAMPLKLREMRKIGVP